MSLLSKYSVTAFVIFFIVLVLNTGEGKAGTQVVSITPATVAAAPGETLNLSINYDVSEGKKMTTGLGLRIFFDSHALEGIKFDQVFGEGLIAVDEKAMDDKSDLDKDPATDKYVGVAWIGVGADWPTLIKLPIILGKMLIKVREGSGLRNTSINIGASSKPLGYVLQGKGAVITLP